MKSFWRVLFLTIVVLMAILPSQVLATPLATQAGPCSCLVYFQRATGLPATGDPNFPAERYAQWLQNQKDNKGKPLFNVSYLSPDTKNPGALNNSYLIWSAKRIGNAYGHIAILESAAYDSKAKKWTFIFRDANGSWSSNQVINGPYTDKNCNNVRRVRWVTTDLAGLTFFRASKR